MQMIQRSFVLMALLALSACVTINVYFPAAEVQEAARDFVDGVIGDDVESAATDGMDATAPGGMAVLDFFIGAAHAANVNVRINTPAVKAIEKRMQTRFETVLKPHVQSGALGFTSDAMIAVRDASVLSLKDRNAVKQAVDEDNRDRAAVYREIAVANGQPSWEKEIRAIFAKQWIASAQSGWYYQDSSGAWKQK